MLDYLSVELLPTIPIDGIIPSATTIRRKRGPSLSRRTGQTGTCFNKTKRSGTQRHRAYGRFWVEMPGGPRRGSVSFGTGPHARSQPSESSVITSKPKASTTRRPSSHQRNAGHDVPRASRRSGWLRCPIAGVARSNPPHFSVGKFCLDKWILPTIGDCRLSEVGNACPARTRRSDGERRLTAKTIVNYSLVLKWWSSLSCQR